MLSHILTKASASKYNPKQKKRKIIIKKVILFQFQTASHVLLLALVSFERTHGRKLQAAARGICRRHMDYLWV